METAEYIEESSTTTRSALSPAKFLKGIWRAKGLWLGLIGLACTLYGQKLVVEQHAIVLAIRWYAVGIILALVAWLGTYKNKSLLRSPDAHNEPAETNEPAVTRFRWYVILANMPTKLRYVLAFAALGLNLFSASLLHTDRYSALGGWGWLASLILLLAAFIGYRPGVGSDADAGIRDVEDLTDWRISRKLEIAIVLGIFALALFLRFYRLGDWTTGVFGDEGEAGVDALEDILGKRASPFGVGWFVQPNFYYWGIAIGLKLFGVSLFGLRFFSTAAGLLMLLPFYPLVRLWFGVRTAIIATVLLAISDVTIHFSRIELSNILTPVSLVIGFCFLFRGLRSKRLWEFVLSGYGFMFGLYFYAGGRLNPIMVGVVLLYLFLLMPLVRLPGVYKQIRKLTPDVSRLRAVRQAARKQMRSVYQYTGCLLIFAIACVCFASPWATYYLDHRQQMEAHASDVLVFNHEQSVLSRYSDRNLQHDPLYLGLRMPTTQDIYPILPVVFEQTPLSIKLADDGFWLRVLWNQLPGNLSMLTYRQDGCGFYSYTQEPAAKPIEAALIILGIAWALWRWRDTRMGVLSIWFWSTIFSGVVTVDAPNVCRLIGILPTMPIFAAIVLGKLTSEFIGVASRIPFNPKLTQRITLILSSSILAALLGYLTWQNFSDYYIRYKALQSAGKAVGQATLVRGTNQKVMGEGRPIPLYYSLGMTGPVIYWGYGVNRFLNHGVQGYDMLNPSNALPVTNNGDRDVVYAIFGWNKQFLSVIKAYYPVGEEATYSLDPKGGINNTLTSYRIKKEQIDARRYVTTTYTSADGKVFQRPEPGFGVFSPLPAQLAYPVSANWTGQLVAPAFARYRFRLEGRGVGADGRPPLLTIDGLRVLAGSRDGAVEGEVILARGLHSVQVSTTLTNSKDTANLLWASGSSGFYKIPRNYLWEGPGRGLSAEIRSPISGDPLGAALPDIPGGKNPPVLYRQVNGFLGYTTIADNFGGKASTGIWKGKLDVKRNGQYQFDILPDGGVTLLIDNRVIVYDLANTGNGTIKSGVTDLTAGTHTFELRYSWKPNSGNLEVFWTPPGGEQTLLGPESFHTDAGAWLPGSVTEPPVFDLSSQLDIKEKGK